MLVERVVGRDSLISISGALGAEATAKGGIEVKFLAKAEAGGTAKGEVSGEAGTEAVRQRRGLQQVVHENWRQRFCRSD